MENTGFIYAAPRPSDFLFGGSSPLGTGVLQADRDWTPFLPVLESQAYKYFDPMDCVTRSATNCLEILHKRKFGEEINFSDRFTAKMSGTTGLGNTFVNVADSMRKDGLILEKDYTAPFDLKSRDEYYIQPGAQLVEGGKDFLKKFEPGYEWVQSDRDVLFDALQYAPIQVAWFYGKPNSDGTYPRYMEKANHGITLVKAIYGKSFFLFDSYPAKVVKEVAWDSLFWGAMRHGISIKQPPNTMPTFEEGKLYQLTEGRGGAFLFSRGQMLTGTEDKVLFAWTIINNGDGKNHVGRLLINDLRGVKLFDMGRNPIPNPYG